MNISMYSELKSLPGPPEFGKGVSGWMASKLTNEGVNKRFMWRRVFQSSWEI